MSTIRFANGDEMPLLGLGTWKSKPGEVYEAVKLALEMGYRHLDCAPIYGNEREVGQAVAEAIAAGVLTREELWITSKLWNNAHAPEDVLPALERTLQDLQTPYLDLWLIHWPVAFKPEVVFPETPDGFLSLEAQPLGATWKGMEVVLKAGLARHIGVSNMSPTKLRAIAASATHPPEMNQVERHPYLAQPELVACARELGCHLTAYSPLGSPDRPPGLKAADEPVLLEDPAVVAIAQQRGGSPAQVLLAWSLQRGIAAIPKSVNATRLRQNLDACALQLSPEDLGALDQLDRHRRYVSGDLWAMPGAPYNLASLWDEPAG
ncbi:MAG: aldo/keto reductase [Candidatus Sericytochromatia bacterium]|nr:aldo/keto reductase [Candidatus Sericytochromatia bacterium]